VERRPTCVYLRRRERARTRTVTLKKKINKGFHEGGAQRASNMAARSKSAAKQSERLPGPERKGNGPGGGCGATRKNEGRNAGHRHGAREKAACRLGERSGKSRQNMAGRLEKEEENSDVSWCRRWKNLDRGGTAMREDSHCDVETSAREAIRRSAASLLQGRD